MDRKNESHIEIRSRSHTPSVLLSASSRASSAFEKLRLNSETKYLEGLAC